MEILSAIPFPARAPFALASSEFGLHVQLERASVVSVQRRSGQPGGPGYRTSAGPGYEQSSLENAGKGTTNASGIQPAP